MLSAHHCTQNNRKAWMHYKWNTSLQETACRHLHVQGQLQFSDLTVLQTNKQRCYEISCQLYSRVVLFLLQTLRDKRCPSSRSNLEYYYYHHLPSLHLSWGFLCFPKKLHISACNRNDRAKYTCAPQPHSENPWHPPAGKESTNWKHQAGKPKAWVGTLSCQLSYVCW